MPDLYLYIFQFDETLECECMPALARYPYGGEVKVTAPHPTDTPGYAPPTPQKFERLQECERIQCGQLYSGG